MFDNAAKFANGNDATIHYDSINAFWLEQVREYANGAKTRDQAIADFKQRVSNAYPDIIVE